MQALKSLEVLYNCSQTFLIAKSSYLFIHNTRKTLVSSCFKLKSKKILQNRPKLTVFYTPALLEIPIIIQPSWGARGRLNKRPRGEIAPEFYEIGEISSIRRIKRP